ncbi:Cytochrome c oxidase assembly protein COX18, mitochondrial [Halotydeus destructor]|nr:Cytochrome c oxidase assembly protein COX18, mitochondrial [Halotydeus destructor]
MCDLSVWITYMFSLRNISIGFPQHLAAETYQQMSTESLGWIPCLTSPDPYMIIPVAAGLISLTNTEYLKSQRQHLPNSNNMFSKSITGIARTAAVILTVVLCYFPTNMSLYWMSFGILNLGKNVLIKNPSVKKLLRIPEIVVPAK